MVKVAQVLGKIKISVTIQSTAGESVGNFVVKALENKKSSQIALRLNS
jgi:fructose-1-phosphate kinase PfkB-like protein